MLCLSLEPDSCANPTSQTHACLHDLYQGGVEKKNSASASAQEAHEAIRPSIVDDRFVHPRDTGITDKKKVAKHTRSGGIKTSV